MNKLTSQQRKLLYLVGIVVLLIPIIALGMPSTSEEGSGGKLAQLRQEYQLGEATLGKVDPSSATMNLVLLGLRGVASTKLWLDAQEQQERKDWGQLRATTDSIILLQPHFIKVWDFQGWNLAYNVSAEWDAVPDRYYWVKEGSKFLMGGTEQNSQFPELYYYNARIIGSKVGEADEWEQFRQYFNEADPDTETYGGLPDDILNPDRKDNYLVARDWFFRANKAEDEREQHVMQRMLFRSHPYRSMLNYAQALQKEGKFEERTRLAWELGFEDWTQKFGQEIFNSPGGRVQFEVTAKDVEALANEDEISPEVKRFWIDSYRNRCNYRYWRTLAQAEKEKLTNRAHRNIYEAKQLFRAGENSPRGENGELPPESLEQLMTGLKELQEVYTRYPTLVQEDIAVEDIMMSLMYMFAIHKLNATSPPSDFPFAEIWDAQKDAIPIIEQQFLRETR